MKSIDCCITITVDLLTLHHNYFYTRFAALSIIANHTRFCSSLWMQFPIRGILIRLFSTHAHWLNSKSIFANSLIIINNKVQKRCKRFKVMHFRKNSRYNHWSDLLALDWNLESLQCSLIALFISFLPSLNNHFVFHATEMTNMKL